MPKSIRNRLLIGFLLFSSVSLFVLIANAYILNKTEEVNQFTSEFDHVEKLVLENAKIMDDFLRYETINENFFRDSKSAFISKEQKLSKEIRNNLDSLKGLNVFPGINQDIQKSLNLLSNYDSSFYSLVNLLKNRGFKDFGLEGEMRAAIHEVEKNAFSNLSTVLMLRRHEKDFIIRNDSKYVTKFNKLIDKYLNQIKLDSKIPSQTKKKLLASITKYRSMFNQLVTIEKRMGLKDNSGLREKLQEANLQIIKSVKKINAKSEEFKMTMISEIENTYYTFTILIVISSVILSFYFSRKSTAMLTMLSQNIEAFVSSNFEDPNKMMLSDQNDEISQLIRNYVSMKKEITKLIQNFQQKVKERTEEIDRQKQQIEIQNTKITQSINAAKRIQNVILPDPSILDKKFPEHLIYYHPKDIVSGDFYWFDETNGTYLIAVADCTGHGVSGAFMSMLGTQILNKIVHEQKITSVDEILNRLHLEVRQTLRQEVTDVKDGMDIAICSINIDKKILEYAGAKSPLLLIQDSNTDSEPNLIHLKGDKYSIGGHTKEGERHFNKTVINLEQDCTLYLYSDGYKDQLGGSKYSRFMNKKFRHLILDNYKKEFEEQEEILHSNHIKWRQDHDQTDDILVFSIRIPVPNSKPIHHQEENLVLETI